MVIPPLIGNPYNSCINLPYRVDDHPLTNGNNGSLDIEIAQQIRTLDFALSSGGSLDPNAYCMDLFGDALLLHKGPNLGSTYSL